ASVADTAQATVTITAQLLRNIGTVTPNTVASFVVKDSKGTAFGTFTSIQASNATGVATAVFVPGGTGHIGQAPVTRTVAGSAATGRGSFAVTAPGSRRRPASGGAAMANGGAARHRAGPPWMADRRRRGPPPGVARGSPGDWRLGHPQLEADLVHPRLDGG